MHPKVVKWKQSNGRVYRSIVHAILSEKMFVLRERFQLQVGQFLRIKLVNNVGFLRSDRLNTVCKQLSLSQSEKRYRDKKPRRGRGKCIVYICEGCVN